MTLYPDAEEVLELYETIGSAPEGARQHRREHQPILKHRESCGVAAEASHRAAAALPERGETCLAGIWAERLAPFLS